MDKKDIMLVQVYVDDIVFGSTKKCWCDEFEALMKNRLPLVKDEEAADVDVHLYRSMIGSLMYLTSFRPDIMYAVCVCSRFQVTPKTSHLQDVKRIFRYLKGQPKLGLWYPRDSPFDLEAYSDSDYVGANLDRKSTIGGCQFLGRRLISWQCKKQTIVATSTTKAKYVAAASCCGQVLWIQNQMDAYEKKLIQVLKIHTNDNVADLLTKAFDVTRIKQGLNFLGKITLLFPSMLTQAAVEEGEDSGTPTESQPTPSPTQPSAGDQPPLTEPSSEHDTSQDPRVNLEGTGGSEGDQVKLPHDSPLSGGHTSGRAEGSFNLEELSILCINLSNRILALETGRKSAKPRPKLDDSAGLDTDGVEYMETKEAVDEGTIRNKTEELNLDAATKVIAEDKGSDEKGESTISTARPKRVSIGGVTISTTDLEVSAVEPKTPPTTTSIFDDKDITMDQTLIKVKEEKAKEKGVAFKEVKESDRPARSVLTLKPLLTIDPKDKGKAVLEEPKPNKMTRSDFDAAQVARYKEIARQLEVELHEEVERKRQRVEQASMDYIANLYDEVQARIDVDHELAVILTHEEQEKYIVDERAKLLAEYFKRRKKELAEERDAAIRNKPPTRTQLRRLMMTYLKHTEKVTNFVPVGSDEDERLIQKMNEKAADVHKEKVLEEHDSTKVLKMKARKKSGKQTHDDDKSSDKGVDSSRREKQVQE
nr:hypothetical protein [Tanacetum cinerariifolium]